MKTAITEKEIKEIRKFKEQKLETKLTNIKQKV